MQILLLLISITALIITALTGTYLFKKYKLNSLKDFDFFILILSLIYLIFGIFTFIWGISASGLNLENLTILISSLIIIQTIALILILSRLQKNKKIIYPISLLLISILPTFLNKSYFHITIPAAFLVIIMTFLAFANEHKSHISILVAYASLSLMFYLTSFITTKPILLLILVSTTIFLLFLAEFLKFLKIPQKIILNHPRSPRSPIILFLKHLIFVIIITNFIFIGTVSTHELGHAVSAQSSECEDTRIIYELNGFPHTEINCEDVPAKQKWILSGILFPFIIALLLMFGGGKSIKEIALEIIGFNLAISYLDFQALGASKIFAVTLMILGIGLSGTGLILLAKSRTE